MKVPTYLPQGNTVRREVSGWIVYVRASYASPTMFKLTARKGSRVLSIDKVSHKDATAFDPDKEWSRR